MYSSLCQKAKLFDFVQSEGVSASSVTAFHVMLLMQLLAILLSWLCCHADAVMVKPHWTGDSRVGCVFLEASSSLATPPYQRDGSVDDIPPLLTGRASQGVMEQMENPVNEASR